ncbi:long-chain fatty acid--CoA ligase [Streptomyces griseochromogenes]|uniref:long-chain fatty acid--CoA ligase n=1 Tax=Streptomyces griseochromogenes TaxID=68214 RepID=UPI0037B5C441
MSDQGIGSWPHRRARIDPAGTALRQGERTLSYARLAERVDGLAGALAARGVRSGDRIAHLGWNSLGAFELFFAAGRLGALFVPLSPRLAPAEITHLMKDCAPAAVVHGPEHAQVAEETCGGAGLVAGPAEQEAMTGEVARPPRRTVGLDDPAVVLYTSGTTGLPKGAVLTHGNLLFNTLNQIAHVDVLSTDVALCVAPLFHATGLGQASLPTLFKGGTVIVDRFRPDATLRTIAVRRVTCFSAVPTMLQMLCEHPDFAHTDLSGLRYVIYGGSPASARVARAWQRRGVTLLHGYGMTEAAPGVTLATARGAAERPLSAGPVHFFSDIRLDGPVPEGPGELLVRGPNVFTGYWRRPADTAAVFTDGWLRSGDIVRVGEEGWVEVVGRTKDVIISGGENIHPAEVEAAIDALDGVKESAVVGVPDERWGEVGVAHVVPEHPGAVTEEQVLSQLRDRVAAFKIPRRVRIRGDLPRTGSGKVIRRALRDDSA